MSHTVKWFQPERIIYMQVEGNITLEETKSVSNDITALLDVGVAPVHLIVDDHAVEKMPSQLRELNKNFEFMRHPAMGTIMSVGKADPILNFVIPMITKIIRVHFVRHET
jgi:hypothetical protein